MLPSNAGARAAPALVIARPLRMDEIKCAERSVAFVPLCRSGTLPLGSDADPAIVTLPPAPETAGSVTIAVVPLPALTVAMVELVLFSVTVKIVGPKGSRLNRLLRRMEVGDRTNSH